MAENINKFLDYSGLQTLWGKIDSLFVRKADIAAEREKLATIAEGAQVNVIENIAVVREGATSATADDMVVIAGKTAVIRVEDTIPATYTEKTPIRPASTKAVKDYVDGKISDVSNQITQKNVSAEGDAYVSASAKDNKVTVVTSQAVKDAADKAAQTASGDNYVSASISNKALTVSTNVATNIATATANKLADAQAVKTYVDDTVGAKNVAAEGDSYVSASASANKVTVSTVVTTDFTADLTNTKALADAKAIKKYVNDTVGAKNVSAEGDSYVSASASANKVTVSTKVTTDFSKDLSSTTALADAKAIKSYVDAEISDAIELIKTASTELLGVSSTEIKDGEASTATIGGQVVTPGKGDIVMYATKEFIWDGGKWILLGDVTAQDQAISEINEALGELEAKDLEIDGKINDINGSIADINSTIEENEKTIAGALNDINSRLDGAAGTASSALQNVVGSTYIDVTAKADNSQTISAKMQDMATASVSKNGIAEAYDVKSYVDGKFNDLSNQITGLDGITSANSNAEITKVATSVTQTDGKVTVQYTEFVALTADEIGDICK